jgi:hypothetical protein
VEERCEPEAQPHRTTERGAVRFRSERGHGQ